MHLVWSLSQLQHGTTFSFDCWGRPLVDAPAPYTLAGGYRFVLSGLKGDQQFLKKTLCIDQSWVSDNICWYCEVSVCVVETAPTPPPAPETK